MKTKNTIHEEYKEALTNKFMQSIKKSFDRDEILLIHDYDIANYYTDIEENSRLLFSLLVKKLSNKINLHKTNAIDIEKTFFRFENSYSSDIEFISNLNLYIKPLNSRKHSKSISVRIRIFDRRYKNNETNLQYDIYFPRDIEIELKLVSIVPEIILTKDGLLKWQQKRNEIHIKQPHRLFLLKQTNPHAQYLSILQLNQYLF